MKEIDFLKKIIECWDKSLELMSGIDGKIYAKIYKRIVRLENFTQG